MSDQLYTEMFIVYDDEWVLIVNEYYMIEQFLVSHYLYWSKWEIKIQCWYDSIWSVHIIDITHPYLIEWCNYNI